MNILDKLCYNFFSYNNVLPDHNINPTQLHVASELGYTELAKYLIFLGVDVNTQNHHGSTPLHIASIHGHTKIVKLLHKYKADISIQDNCGLIPLDMASIHGNTKIVKLLCKYEADISIQDHCGSTPLDGELQCDNTDSDTWNHNMLDEISIDGDQAPLLG